MKILNEFKAFIAKGNVLDLAVAVVLGGAFGKIVTSMVQDLIMPIVSAVLPSGEWRTYTVTPLKIAVGNLLGASVDFVIMAFVIFLVVKQISKVMQKKAEAPATAPATKQCPECLENIPAAAKRCRACTSVQK